MTRNFFEHRHAGSIGILLSLLFATSAKAAMWVVPGDFATIQAAIDSPTVMNGDTIMIAAGEYSNPASTGYGPQSYAMYISKELTIQGAGNDSNPASGTVFAPVSTGGQATNGVVYIDADNVTFRDIYIDAQKNLDSGTGQVMSRGFQTAGPIDNLTINNVTVSGTSHSCAELNKTTNSLLLDLTCDTTVADYNGGFNARGVRVVACTNLTIENLDVLGPAPMPFDGSGYGLVSFQETNSYTLRNVSLTGDNYGQYIYNQFLPDAHTVTYEGTVAIEDVPVGIFVVEDATAAITLNTTSGVVQFTNVDIPMERDGLGMINNLEEFVVLSGIPYRVTNGTRERFFATLADAQDDATANGGVVDEVTFVPVNATPDVIFGSGNANGSFVLDRQDSVELGLRAKVRFPVPMNVFNSNGDGTYTYGTGAGGGGSPTPLWSFEWTVNTDYDDSSALKIDDLTYELGIDFDAGPGTNYLAFDNITPAPPTVPFWDHAIGDNTTVNGGGTSAGDASTYASLIAANNVAQNSWRMDFFDDPPFDVFDPEVPGRYEFYQAAFDGGTEVARTAMTVIVVDGTTMSLEADPCQTDLDAVKVGIQVAVEVWLRNPDDVEVTGYQAFLAYDDTKMTYEGACSYYSPAPFGVNIQDIATAVVDTNEIRLDGNTGAATGPTGDALLATLVFTVLECDPSAVTFDLGQGFDSEFSFGGTALTTALLEGASVVADQTPPSITCPADIAQAADANVGNGCVSAVVTWADPVATDSCTDVSVSCYPPSGSAFPAGVITEVTCTATDACGNTDVCTFDVEVTETNVVCVDVQLVGVVGSPTRCIHFVTDDCSYADVELTFDGTGLYTGEIEVPCGTWTTLCAKDEQHTKWASAGLELSGTKYVLSGAAVLGLRAGDTDNDGDVDINDVTLFLAQQGGGAEPFGDCPWNGVRGADFSDNGNVSTEDYSLMTPQWLTVSSCACSSPLVGDFGDFGDLGDGRVSVLVAELDPWVAARADLNTDGRVDYKDVQIFEQRNRLPGTLSKAMKRSADVQSARSSKSLR